MASESRRLSILTAQEIHDLYDLPRFTEEDRHFYFDLGPAERELVDGVFTISVAVHLVLQLGYFKAKRQFFVYKLDAVAEDASHILQRYFPARERVEIKSPSRSTRLDQQQIILKLFDSRPCDAGAKKELEGKAQRVAMLSAQPVFILREACSKWPNDASSHPATPTCRTWWVGPSRASVSASPCCLIGR